MNLITILIGGLTLGLWNFILFQNTSRILSKKCNYDCSKCKCWSCNKYQCLKYSKNTLKEEEKND